MTHEPAPSQDMWAVLPDATTFPAEPLPDVPVGDLELLPDHPLIADAEPLEGR